MTMNVWALPGYIPGNEMHATWSRRFSKHRYEARRRGIQFNISLREAWDLINKQQWKCALTGVDFRPNYWSNDSEPGKANDRQPSLDRINSSGIYEIGNVQYVTYRMNIIKGSRPNADFVNMCRLVAASHESDN